MKACVHVIGGGLAGSECALQLAKRNVDVLLYEQRPKASTPAHTSAYCAELVCSNSFKSQKTSTAAGTLKAELNLMGSELLNIAQHTAVRAGGALAVDREEFAQTVTDKIHNCANIRYCQEEVCSLDELAQKGASVVVATGPLTSETLLSNLQAIISQEIPNLDSQRQLLHFFDAAAPIVDAHTLNEDYVFSQSRYEAQSDGDYLNCPLSKDEYECFVDALLSAQTVIKRDFEKGELFQACQPIEEIAKTGRDALRFGPMKPVGLINPKTGKRPYAVVQLRAENQHRQAFNLVGFQTNLTWPEQKRVFSLIPGLKGSSFLRYGVMHRNTFVDAPRVLDDTFALKANSNIQLAGQISGSEGYTEAIGSGLLAALNAFARIKGYDSAILPVESVFGALCSYCTNPATHDYQPMHVNFGLLPPLSTPIKNKRLRHEALSLRAVEAIDDFVAARPELFSHKPL